MTHPNLFDVPHANIKDHSSVTLNEQELASSMSGICQLPEELLLLILGELQIKPDRSSSQHNVDFYKFDEYDISWIRMTWVCRRIRNVAISSPELWTRVYSKQTREWNALVISRAEHRDLIIDLSHVSGGDMKTPAENLSRSACTRIQHWGKHTQKALVLHTDFSTNARITIFHAHVLPNLIAISFTVSLANQLVELCLSDTSLASWPRLEWPRLRRLGLMEPYINPEDLVVILHDMSQIEVLSISNLRHRASSDVEISNGIPNSFPCDRIHKVSIIDHPRNVLQILERISQMKRSHHFACLDLQVKQYWNTDTEVPILLAHLMNEWGWNHPISSDALFRDRNHSSGQYSLVLFPDHSSKASYSSAGSDVYTASKIQIHCKLEENRILRGYQAVITSLEIEGARRSLRKKFFNDLNELISPRRFPNIARIVFRRMYDTQLIREWMKGHEALGGPALEAIYDGCEDSNYVFPADEL
jgi:hypothetical protein